MSLQTARFPDIPEPKLLDVNYDADLRLLKESYQVRTGHYPGINDPETVTLEQMAYEKNELKEMINEEGKQNLLPFASGPRLDNLGLLTETDRLPASSALTIIKFTMKAHSGFVINDGFEMMAIDGQTVFVTTKDTAISPSEMEIAISFECKTTGIAGNNFAPGQIAQMVKPLEYVLNAENIETSNGGAEIEDDAAYAYRIYLSPSKFSTCGPYDAYEFFALSANSSIKSVSVTNPSPNRIDISAILEDGSLPNQAIKDQIKAECTGEKRVPMGDLVEIIDVIDVTATVSYTLYIFSDYTALADQIKASAQLAIQKVIDNWKTQHGRDIVPAALSSLAQSMEGVYYVESTMLDENGDPITTTKQLSKDQRPVITITDFTFVITNEQSQVNETLK